MILTRIPAENRGEILGSSEEELRSRAKSERWVSVQVCPFGPQLLLTGTLAYPDPLLDGQTHINVCSHGETLLGQRLSNFAHTPFHHPQYGSFASIEALWYWALSDHPQREGLRQLYGFEAKQRGRLLVTRGQSDEHREIVTKGLKAKADAFPNLGEEIREADKPLLHYYVFSGGVRIPSDWTHQWWARKFLGQ